MFGKYLWHELKNTYKLPLIASLIGLFTSLFCGIVTLIPFSTVPPFIVIFIVSLLILSFLFIGVIIIITIIRTFRSRLFNQQGYLTLTLPVSAHTILISKILVNLLYAIVYTLIIILMVRLYISAATGFSDGVLILRALFEQLFGYGAIPGILMILNYLLSFLATITILLLLMSIYYSGGAKWGKVLIIIGIVLVVLVGNSVLQSANANFYSLYYVINMDTIGHNGYLFKTLNEMNEIAADNYARDVVTDFVKILDTANYLRSIVIIVVSYILSHYLVKRRIDIK